MKQSSKDVLLNLLPYFAATLLAASIIFLQKPPYFTSDEETSLKMKVKIYSSTLLKEGVLLLSITDDSLAKPLSDTPKTLLNLDISSYIVEFLTKNGKGLPFHLPKSSVAPFSKDLHGYRFIFLIEREELHKTPFLIVKFKLPRIKPFELKVLVPEIDESNHIEHLQQAAVISAMIGEGEQVLKFSKTLIAELPLSPVGYFYQGIGYELQKKEEKAVDSYREALARTTTPLGEVPAYLLFNRFTALASQQ
ncbi:MAG: hypothetical protein ACOX2O_03565 [Bdellovibrionota bacterium]|jgi:hypothetical protein